MLDLTPSPETPLAEVLDCYAQGFISHREFTLYQLRRLDNAYYRTLLSRITGVDACSTNEQLAQAYQDFLVSRRAGT